MLHVKAALSLGALTVSAAVAAYVEQGPKPEPVFIAGSQYSAVLHQRSHQWLLLSPDGSDLNVSNAGASCAAQAPLPNGVWLVSYDSAHRPVLLAPSVTPLPKGHSGQVRLVDCGDRGEAGRTLAVRTRSRPRALITRLSSRTEPGSRMSASA